MYAWENIDKICYCLSAIHVELWFMILVVLMRSEFSRPKFQQYEIIVF